MFPSKGDCSEVGLRPGAWGIEVDDEWQPVGFPLVNALHSTIRLPAQMGASQRRTDSFTRWGVQWLSSFQFLKREISLQDPVFPEFWGYKVEWDSLPMTAITAETYPS